MVENELPHKVSLDPVLLTSEDPSLLVQSLLAVQALFGDFIMYKRLVI
jgi:hypothetical protein